MTFISFAYKRRDFVYNKWRTCSLFFLPLMYVFQLKKIKFKRLQGSIHLQVQQGDWTESLRQNQLHL